MTGASSTDNFARLSVFGLLAVVWLSPAAVFHGVAVAPRSNHAWVTQYEPPSVFHTADLGSTWTLQTTFFYHRNPYDVFFLDSLSGWVCGKAGGI